MSEKTLAQLKKERTRRPSGQYIRKCAACGTALTEVALRRVVFSRNVKQADGGYKQTQVAAYSTGHRCVPCIEKELDSSGEGT